MPHPSVPCQVKHGIILSHCQVSTWFANARRRMKKAVSEEDDSCSSQGSGSGSDCEGSPDCNNSSKKKKKH